MISENLSLAIYVNPLTPKIWLLVLPSGYCTFPFSHKNKNVVLDQDY